MSELLEQVGQDQENEQGEKKKRTVKEFLKQYRALGLPGAKKMRRRTRLNDAQYRHDADMMLVSQLITQMKAMIKLMNELKNESNWAVSGEAVVWVGESDPLTLISNTEKALQGK